jgi:DHA1 family 2-module integral membrane pump EmrD-like MFS transporter
MQEEQVVEPNSQRIPLLIVFAILMLMVLMQTTTDQYIPSLPAIAALFQSNESSIQLTLTFFMLGLSSSHLFYGPLSDRIGRKFPLMFGVGLSIAGSVFCFFAPSVGVLIFGRFLQGFGIGCCSSVGRSLVRDLFADRLLAKIGSYVGIVSVFIMAASPTLGGYIQEHYGWRANFLFLIIFGLIVWVMAMFILPETNKNLNPDAMKMRVMAANYLSLLRSKVFIGYTLCACFAFAGLVSYLTIAPFLFQNILGLSPLQFGQLTIFIAVAICISGIINSQLVMHKGIPFMVFIGVMCMSFGGFSLLIVSILGKNQIFFIMLPISLFSVGAGFTFINAFPGAFHSFPHIAGTAAALYACLQDLSGSLASALIALCKGYGIFSLAIILLVLGLSSLAAWYYLAIQNEPVNGDVNENK